MEHHFNIYVANIVGINAAIIFKNISHWCEKNKANKENLIEGEYWTYNSIKAFTELFPYMSAKQITSALNKLKETGFIDIGEFNKNPYDRTKWYCDLTLKNGLNEFLSTCTKSKMEITERSNVDLDKRYKCITDNKQQIVNTDNKHLNINTETSSVEDSQDLFGNTLEVKTLVPVEEEKNKKETARYLIVDFWLKEFHPGWGFSKVDGKKINEIIKKIKKTLSDSNYPETDENVVNLFKAFCLKMPEFYKSETLSVLDSKYYSITQKIKEEKNGKQQNSNYVNKPSVSKGSEIGDFFGSMLQERFGDQ